MVKQKAIYGCACSHGVHRKAELSAHSAAFRRARNKQAVLLETKQALKLPDLVI